MKVIKFQYDGKLSTLREDGRIKRDGQLFFQKDWHVNRFIVRDDSEEKIAIVKTDEVFELLREPTNGRGNPVEHLTGAMISGTTGGKEGFREGRPVELIYAE